MAQVKTVARARESKNKRACRTCGHEVQPGERYKYIAKKTGPRSSMTIYFCKDHNPRLSDTLSGREAELQKILEDFEESIRRNQEKAPLSLEDTRNSLQELIDNLEGMVESLQEAAENMESGFGHPTSRSEALNDAAEELESWRDEMESHCSECPEEEDPEKTWEEREEEIREWVERAGEFGNEAPGLSLQG